MPLGAKFTFPNLQLSRNVNHPNHTECNIWLTRVYRHTELAIQPISSLYLSILSTTRLQFFPDGQKPSGLDTKPSGIIFPMVGRQEPAVRMTASGITCYSRRLSDKNPFLSVFPDGLEQPGKSFVLSEILSGIPVRKNGRQDSSFLFLTC
jgi:hypothetical protein